MIPISKYALSAIMRGGSKIVSKEWQNLQTSPEDLNLPFATFSVYFLITW